MDLTNALLLGIFICVLIIAIRSLR